MILIASWILVHMQAITASSRAATAHKVMPSPRVRFLLEVKLIDWVI
jgi:hypothetical protein